MYHHKVVTSESAMVTSCREHHLFTSQN